MLLHSAHQQKDSGIRFAYKSSQGAVLMGSFVVGSDRDFFKSLSEREQEKFFADCTRFFSDRYGEENIISVMVHMDESTPHLPLNLIPIAEGRLCAKQLFDRKALQPCRQTFILLWERNGTYNAARKAAPQSTLTQCRTK